PHTEGDERSAAFRNLMRRQFPARRLADRRPAVIGQFCILKSPICIEAPGCFVAHLPRERGISLTLRFSGVYMTLSWRGIVSTVHRRYLCAGSSVLADMTGGPGKDLRMPSHQPASTRMIAAEVTTSAFRSEEHTSELQSPY